MIKSKIAADMTCCQVKKADYFKNHYAPFLILCAMILNFMRLRRFLCTEYIRQNQQSSQFGFWIVHVQACHYYIQDRQLLDHACPGLPLLHTRSVLCACALRRKYDGGMHGPKVCCLITAKSAWW